MDFPLPYQLALGSVRRIFHPSYLSCLTLNFFPLMNRGLAIVFAEDPQGQVNGTDSEVRDPNWDKLCPIWNSLPDSEH